MAGQPSPLTGVLHGIQADVPTGNLCWCFRSDTFNNALLGRECNVMKPCLKRYFSINTETLNRILMTFHDKLE